MASTNTKPDDDLQPLDFALMRFAEDIAPCFHLACGDEMPSPTALKDCLAKGTAVIIDFPVFSDGRGFTLARQLRQALPAPHPIVAAGHIIPDQADFLFRSGFSHAMINPLAFATWQTALGMVSIRFQHMPNSPRTR